jgi:hypothetical protein
MMAIFDETMIDMDIENEAYTSSGYEINYSNGYKIEISYDEYSESPREWDNFGKMYYWHRNYILGDKEVDLSYYNSFEDFIEQLSEDWGEIIWLPLFLYDHSGITMSTSTSSFKVMDSQGWDWGCCGIIFASYDDIKKAFMTDEITEDILEKATKCLIGEVETFDQYITNDVYSGVIYDENGYMIDSLGGMYGYEYAQSEMKQMAEWHWNNRMSKTPVQGVLFQGE